MSQLLAPESRISLFLNTIGDLILLNLLTVCFSLPLFTFGMAFTSMYQVMWKLIRREEGSIWREYLSACRQNFRKSTAVWLAGGGLMAFICLDIFLLYYYELPFSQAYRILLFVLLVFVLLFTFFILVTAAYFENSLKNTIINGMKFCMIHILVSVLMLALTLAPLAALYLTFRVFILIFLLGLSGPAYICGLYFADLFRRFES